MNRRRLAAIGFTTHTGWAVAVVVRGSASTHEIEARTRVELLPDPARFVFHRAAEGAPSEAAAAILRAREAATKAARTAIVELVARAMRGGAERVACAIVAKQGAIAAPLAALLAAHPRIHAAEGLFYRDVLKSAAEAESLVVEIVPPDRVEALAMKALACDSARLTKLLSAYGREFGPPWGKDQKTATLAAWTLL